MPTVLILDDDPSNLHAFNAIFAGHGYHVLEATTEDEAIRLSKDCSQIDLFVCDLALETSSGTDVALQFCRMHPRVPVLFVSGTPMYAWEKQDVNNFLKFPLDIVDCLEKPFRASALLEKANKLLENGAQRPRGRSGDAG